MVVAASFVDNYSVSFLEAVNKAEASARISRVIRELEAE